MFDKTGMAQYLEHLQNCSESRVDELSADFARSAVYCLNSRNRSALYEEIRAALSPDILSILSQYSDAENVLQGKTQTYFYEQGFWDGVRLMRLLLLGDIPT